MKTGRRRRGLVRLRHLLRRVAGSGPTRLLKQAYRLILLVSAALIVDAYFPGRSAPDLPVFEEGRIAEEDIIASMTFPVFKSESQLSQERAAAASAISPIFDHRPELADSAIARAARFFAAIDSAAATPQAEEGEESPGDAIRRVLDEYRIAASDTQVALLRSSSARRELSASIAWSFRNILRNGAASSGDLGPGTAGGIVLRSAGVEALVPRDSVPTLQQLYERAARRAPEAGGVATLRLYQNLVIRLSQPTIRLNDTATQLAQSAAQQAVDPVDYMWLESDTIVRADERIGRVELERLRAYQAALAQEDGGFAWDVRLGSVVYNLLLILVFGLVVRYYRPEIYASTRSLTLLWLLLLAVSGASALIAGAGWPPELIPVAFAALLLASLYDGSIALLAVFVLVALVAARPPLLGMAVLFSTTMGGAAAALSGRVVRRRAHSWAFAAVIAGAYVMAAISLALMLRLDAVWVLSSALFGTVNGVVSTALVMIILPAAESFTNITTDQSLLELADLNRPLLRRISLEAPGTYAHSINVANLAEAAAREIGANSLLVRVGVYYHDIGKVKKPQYFVENQPPGRNPHDRLKPAMSASIVREHVEEGLQLAAEARLPEVVKAFITEHHGTQRIGFFWERARELDPDADLDIREFTYPGPKPQSQETAIVLMADSVESAARALQDPTPDSIEEVVDRVVGFKIGEGQLDEAPLTMREITVIKEQFVKVLSGMYHHRIDYPTPDPEAPRAEEAAASGMP